MPLESNIYALWFGKQAAKGTELTTPTHRCIQVGGDIATQRDDGSEQWSDLTTYGNATDWVNSISGSGSPAIEATPSETAALLWAAHGVETFTSGTNNVWTLSGNPTSGAFVLQIADGSQLISVASQANTVTSAALATAINSAMTAAGHTGTPVACAGGPLNTTPITVTFNGATTSSKPFYLTKGTDTTSPAVTLTNTTPGVKPKHSVKPGLTAPHWCTWVRRTGTSVIQRHSFIDTLVTGFTLEGSTANKALRITPSLLSLDPGKVLAADPAQALPTGVNGRPFLYTEGTGTFTMDGVVQAGQSQFTFTVNEDRSPVYGDDVTPVDMAVGDPSATIGATVVFDSTGLADWNRLVYGTASPAAGTKPQKYLPALGSYSFNIQQKDAWGNLTGNRMVLTIPGVKWRIPEAPAPNPQGGNTEIALAGQVRTVGSSDPYTIDIYNDDATYTA